MNSKPLDIKCDKVHSMISDCLAGELSHKDMLFMLAHLKECSECTAYRWEMERTWTLMDEWTTPSPPDTLDIRFEERFNKEFGKNINSGKNIFDRFIEWWKPVWGTMPGRIAAGIAVIMVMSLAWTVQSPDIQGVNNTGLIVSETDNEPEIIEKTDISEPVEVADSFDTTEEMPEALMASNTSSEVPSSWVPISSDSNAPLNELGIFVEDSQPKGTDVRTVQYVINPGHSGPVYLIFPQNQGGTIEN